MIIKCNNCSKKFDIESILIPEKGRLLQCSSCNHKWFFKKEITNKTIEPIKIDIPTKEIKITDTEIETIKADISENIELLDKQINEEVIKKEEDNKKIANLTSKNKKNYSILGLIIVFIISFIALIIILDTFQTPISKFIPNIEIILYNLYESINDINLFFKDLI
tara:strand:- start:127 stop:621 length:495 start_codon:yes stop_codon:yes gene_type:complete